MKRRLAGAALLWGCLLPGCAVGPKYRAPTPALPHAWNEACADGLAPGPADVQTWWDIFADPTLSDLIKRAAEGNLDLRAAVLRIRQARALRGIAAGELLPALNANASYERSKASANGPAGGVGVPSKGAQFADSLAQGMAGSALGNGLAAIMPGAPGITGPLSNALMGLAPKRHTLPDPDEQDLFATGFDASWEIDVFGGIRRNVEAAGADLSAAINDYRAVQVSLLAEVATTYIDLRALQSQIESTQRNIELQKETLALTQSRLDARLGSELDVSQAQTNLATTESALPLLQTGVALATYRLSVLLGLEPAALQDELAAQEPIPHPQAETLVGLPADIIRRRPDIRAAERRLAAETARIGVATADLYPHFTLSGTFGFEATDFNHFLDGRSASYGFGPAVHWNIFDGLRNLNRIAAQQAVTHEAYVSYEQILLLALEDVETSMVAYKREQTRWEALRRAAESARNTVHIARASYEDGLTDFQNVVDAERALVVLENSLAQSRGQVAVNLVSVYKALGGGWSPDQMPQAQYLETPADVLADPLKFFLWGGKTALPWSAESGQPEQPPPPATTPENEPAAR